MSFSLRKHTFAVLRENEKKKLVSKRDHGLPKWTAYEGRG